MTLIILCLLVMVLTTLNHLSIEIFPFDGGFCFYSFSFLLIFADWVVRGSADLIVHLHCLLVPPSQCILIIIINSFQTRSQAKLNLFKYQDMEISII